MTPLVLRKMFGDMPSKSVFEAILNNLATQEQKNLRLTEHLNINQTLNDPNLVRDGRRKYGGLVSLWFHSLAFDFVENYLELCTAWSSDKDKIEDRKKECAILLSFFTIGAYEYARQIPEDEFKEFLIAFNNGVISNFFLFDKDLYSLCVADIYQNSKSYFTWISSDEQDGTKRFFNELRKLFIAVALTDSEHDNYVRLVELLKKYYAMYAQQFSAV